MSDNLLVEVRYVEDDTRQSPGRLQGTLLTYGELARDRPELFMPDALTWPDDGIVINEQHNRQSPVVRALPFVEGRELRIDAALPNTTRGRDAATNVKEGVLTGLSVEFARAGVVASLVNGVRTIRSARLVAAALVDLSSYAGSNCRDSGVCQRRQSQGVSMAVTITRPELRDALRLEADQDTTDEIDRILRYAATAVTRNVATAPDVVHDEAVVRLASYLFDQPSTSRGAAYSGALRNSGAAAILAPYRRRRGGNVSGVESAGVGVGIDSAAARVLIADALDTLDIPGLIADGIAAGGAPPVHVTRIITNAELKTLDDTYIELAPAPGFDKYIQVRQVYLEKHGSDTPPERDYSTYVAISADDVLTAGEINAGTSDGLIPTWAAGDRYLFVGRSITDGPLERAHIAAADRSIYADDLPMTRIAGTMDVAGLPVWWWRSTDVVPQSVSAGRVTYIRQSVPTMARLYGYARLFVMFVGDDSLALPLHSDDPYTAATGYLFASLLNQADGYSEFEAIGGHGLIDNTPLQLGILIGDRRQYRDTRGWAPDTWDTFMSTVDDTELTVRVSYQIHDVA